MSPEEVSFGPFTLSPGERRLTRDGADVALGARSLDILAALVASPSQPLSKRVLLAEAWPDVTVGEASLRLQIANLRKALGDGENGARYIETLSGRGYCFVAPVTRAQPAAPKITGNLPLRPPLIGRDQDLAEVAELLSTERLVTIVGPGGVGKTRLAIAAARQTASAYPDGVWLADLAPLADPSQVIGAVAAVLGLARGAAALSPETIIPALRRRRLLLVLDNCEHLVASTAELAWSLAQGIPGLTVIATSQEALRLETECVYRLDPLELPPPGAVDIHSYGAVQLFTHRARSVDRRFSLNETNASTVSEVCRRLDGMPLSLEMAAARVPSMGIEGLRASLEARLRVLSTGLRTTDARHQTLRSAVEWSVGLLDETEAVVFRRLGVFSGGFSLEAAMAVAASGEINGWGVADTLARLADKSVVFLERSGRPRYRLLETLRLSARERLLASGEWDRLAESHLHHFCGVFAPARDAWQVTPDPEWEAVYMPEIDNLRAALDWCLASPVHHELLIELVAATAFIWGEWGLLDEGRRLLTSVRGRLDGCPPSSAVAAILRDHGEFCRTSGRIEEAQREFARSAAISSEVGDDLALARANHCLAHCCIMADRHEDAATFMHGAAEAFSIGGHKRSLASASTALAVIALHDRRYDEAVDQLALAAELASELKDGRREQSALCNLGLIEFTRDNVERAIQIGEESVLGSRAVPQPFHLEVALENLGMYLVAATRLDEARPIAAEALSLVRDRPGSDQVLRNLQQWALIAALEGQDREAARLIGWVDAAYGVADVPRNEWEVSSYDRLLSQLKPRLTDAGLSTLAAEGARWDAVQAINFAFERIIRRSEVGA